MFSLICAWINGWVNNREAGDLRHHRAHYDVMVMGVSGFVSIICFRLPLVTGDRLLWWNQSTDWISNWDYRSTHKRTGVFTYLNDQRSMELSTMIASGFVEYKAWRCVFIVVLKQIINKTVFCCTNAVDPRYLAAYFSHDDVIKWKHFPRYCSVVRGIHRWPVNSPLNVHWRGAFMFSLICTWINGWVNNREAGDLRHHCAHYDVSVMGVSGFVSITCFRLLHPAERHWWPVIVS